MRACGLSRGVDRSWKRVCEAGLSDVKKRGIENASLRDTVVNVMGRRWTILAEIKKMISVVLIIVTLRALYISVTLRLRLRSIL